MIKFSRSAAGTFSTESSRAKFRQTISWAPHCFLASHHLSYAALLRNPYEPVNGGACERREGGAGVYGGERRKNACNHTHTAQGRGGGTWCYLMRVCCIAIVPLKRGALLTRNNEIATPSAVNGVNSMEVRSSCTVLFNSNRMYAAVAPVVDIWRWEVFLVFLKKRKRKRMHRGRVAVWWWKKPCQHRWQLRVFLFNMPSSLFHST